MLNLLLKILSPVRLRKLIQTLCLVLLMLLFGLGLVFHQTLVFRGSTTAYISSYNLGRVNKHSVPKTKEIVQVYRFDQFLPQKCNNETTSSEIVSTTDFWISLDDETRTQIRSSAYLDVRYFEQDGAQFRYIKLLSMSLKRTNEIENPSYCSFSQPDGQTVSVLAKTVEIWLPQWNPLKVAGVYHSYIVECLVPSEIEENPSFVFISTQSCKFKYKLPVRAEGLSKYLENGRKHGQGICVCVKPLDFEVDNSHWIVEWIESNKLLGAAKIVMYVYHLHKNVRKALEFYQSQGFVELIPWQLPSGLPSDDQGRRNLFLKNIWQKRRSEVVPYNECFYNNMYNYTLVLPIDVDEIIFPIKFQTWNDLMDYVFLKDPSARSSIGSFAVRNAHFFVEKSNKSELVTVESVIRNANLSKPGERVKSFVNTQVGEVIFNHYVFGTVRPRQLKNLHLSPQLVQMNHYKDDSCQAKDVQNCDSLHQEPKIEDKRFAEKFGQILKQKVSSVIQILEE